MPLPDFEPGTIVQLTGGGITQQRKLSYGGDGRLGSAFADDYLTAAEAAATFIWLGLVDDRDDITAVLDAVVRSTVSGREGRLGRALFRRATKRGRRS